MGSFRRIGYLSVASRRLPWVIAVWGVSVILKAAISISLYVRLYHTPDIARSSKVGSPSKSNQTTFPIFRPFILALA
jgi:hypothetical protein